jgi:polyisoprenoid-binding protein YceI
MNRLTIAAAATTVFAFAYGYTTAASYSLKDPKGVNTITFTLDGRFEHIQGYTTAIEGDIAFDPAAPEKTTGKVVVQAGSLQTTMPGMANHIKEPMWLDAVQFPTIEFDVKSVANVKKLDGPDAAWSMDVTGDFTLRGVTKQITVPVRITHLPGQLSKRNRGAVGDLMAVRSSFSFNRRDFGVVGNQTADIVSDEVRVSFSLAAFSPRAN